MSGPVSPCACMNLIFHSIFLKATNATKRIASMAASCLCILSVTEILSQYLEVDNEIWLYGTCPPVYQGNKAHRDILKELRDFYYTSHCPPTLQRHRQTHWLYQSQGSNQGEEVVQRAPPLYWVWAELRFEDLYDRRPETMPIPDSCSPEPAVDVD